MLVRGLPPQQEAIRDRCVHPTGKLVEFKAAEVEQSIPERFEQIVGKYPGRIAVKTSNRQFTYEQLNGAANRVARAILAQRGEREESIALLLEHDTPMIVAIIGVLKAGKICVILDPSFPRPRNAYILGDSQVSLLVTDRKNLSLAKELAQDKCLLMNIDDLDAGLSIEKPALSISPSPDHLTYIVYTSGSTGEPKGVLQNHRNGLHEAMLYANGLHISVHDRLALLYSCSVSQGMKITFGALLNGAALCLFNLHKEGIGNLTGWLIQEEITIYFSIPIVFRQWVSAFTGQETFPKLRLIQLGSDSVTPRDVQEYKKYFSTNSILVVRLGSTETGTLRRHFFDRETPLVEEMVPVGYAIDDMEVFLLDEEGKNVDGNRVGEIAVKSRYLAVGYWHRPDLTRAKFLQHPGGGGDEHIYLTGDLGRMLPDGCLLHLGRKGFQVKIRGYRVEPAEVEMALLDHGSVREVAVVAREDQDGSPRLVAYFVPKSKPGPGVGELRSFSKQKLPDYMIPSAFVKLPALPLTPNGKVNRPSLPDPGKSRPDLDTPLVLPRTPVEEELAEIWAEVLSLDQVGVDDDFFHLGGQSLLATQILSRVRQRLEVDLPMNVLFAKATIHQLALTITEMRAMKLNHK